MRVSCVTNFLFVAALLTSSSISATAQTAPPNADGVSIGHIHFVVPDPDAAKKIWTDVFGAVPVKSGALTPLKLPGIFIIVTKANTPPTGGTDGSVVNHIGFLVKSYADIKAKAAPFNPSIREIAPNVQGLFTFPDGVIVEVIEDKTISAPVVFHHIHEFVVDQEGARAWYVKEFGGEKTSRRNWPAAKVPGVEIDFQKSDKPLAGTKGRSLDHIGFEVTDLAATLKRLEADGVTINMPLRDLTKQIDLKIAYVTDPNGTYIELTQGLAAK